MDTERIALKYERLQKHREDLVLTLRGGVTPEKQEAIRAKLERLDLEIEVIETQEKLATLRARRGDLVVSPGTARLGAKGA